MSVAMLGTAATAQETYDNAQLAAKDLNGTARYVGMGGAMEALGADISTMGSNPAGIGLFRRSMVNLSFGTNTQSDAKDIGKDRTNMSFDQAGFVYSMRSGRKSYVNFGVSYNKSRNFNQILTAVGALHNASQNKLSAMKNYNDVYRLGRNNGKLTSTWNGTTDYTFSQLDYLYSNGLLSDANSQLIGMSDNNVEGGNYIAGSGTELDANGKIAPAFYNATGFSFARGASGYIGEYNFDISGNVNDRFYWGLTFGLYDVNYKNNSVYTESLVNASNNSIGDVTIADERKTTGTGFDVKAGVIFRPVEDSPFRIGLYVHTPTWYDLSTTNNTSFVNGLQQGYGNRNDNIGERYDYKFYTPWRFGASLGHTVGNYLALGVTYEFTDYSTSDIRVNDGGSYDYWGNYYEETYRDESMKSNIKSVLKGVSTLKAGVEYKPISSLALRLGYNYVSPMYKKTGYKDATANSYSTYYSSTTDYTNWKAINRITAGLGYSYKQLSVDLAYQYSCQKGDFYPFMSYADPSNIYAYDNVSNAVEVTNKHHQLLLTLGYRF